MIVVGARVVLGLLFLREGYVKYHAGFGAADIRLVVRSAVTNPRVPEQFTWFATEIMDRFATGFGVLVPITEVALGAAAVLGILPRVVALGAVALLSVYWASDQLIAQYPPMVLFSGVILAGGTLAQICSVPAILTRRVRGRAPAPNA